MPPNGAPCGAARVWRKGPKGGAQDARQFAARTRMCAQRTPEHPREVGGQATAWMPEVEQRRTSCRMPGDRATGGVLSLVTFFAQAKKVTRSPAGRVEALQFKDDRAKS